jgi:SAM-dependent methyltransferase
MAGTLWQSDIADDDREPPKVDTSVAHIARIYDYWLGGKNHFAADREAGDEAVHAYPDMHMSVRQNRAFLQRAVRYLAGAGIRQFLDIGTGLPSADNTHEIAQAVAPESRVVYVDNDPIVLAHARALLTSSPEGVTGYLDADARETGTIITEAGKLLDFGQPVAVMLIAVLHLIPEEDDPYQLVADLLAAVPSGSYLVVSHVASDLQRQSPGINAAAARLSQVMFQRVTARSQDQVLKLFNGLEILEPGIVPVQDWRPDGPQAGIRSAMRGGIGRKP